MANGSGRFGWLIGLGLLILAILILGLLASCDDTPDPETSPMISPLAAQVVDLPEVPEATGYLAVSLPDYWPVVTGTLIFTRELRAFNDDTLAFWVDTQAIVFNSSLPITTTIGPAVLYDGIWPIAIDETAVEWVRATLVVSAPVSARIPALFYSNLQTLDEPDARGFRQMRIFEINNIFLPIILR